VAIALAVTAFLVIVHLPDHEFGPWLPVGRVLHQHSIERHTARPRPGTRTRAAARPGTAAAHPG